MGTRFNLWIITDSEIKWYFCPRFEPGILRTQGKHANLSTVRSVLASFPKVRCIESEMKRRKNLCYVFMEGAQTFGNLWLTAASDS
jgi:hypothetical protein